MQYLILEKDLLEVNGYDERFIGYGFEDIDLPARLRRLGVKKDSSNSRQ